MPAEVTKEKKLITYVWFTIMFWVFFACIVAIAVAAMNDHCHVEAACSKSKAFAGFWNVMMCVAIFFFGTRVFQRNQNAFAIGSLLGVIFILQCPLATKPDGPALEIPLIPPKCFYIACL